MKIKTDFVTNSSSTCFVLMSKGELTLTKFLKAAGVDKNSPFLDMFKEIFHMFADDLTPARDFTRMHRWSHGRSYEQFIKEVFSEKTWQRVQDAEEKGMTVYMGDLHSDNGALECVLCTDCFVIDNTNLVIDATNDSW